MNNKKKISINKLKVISSKKKRVVFVHGNFNVVHPGHLRLLNFAKSCGDFLVVAISSDQTPGAFISRDLRIEGISSIGIVDAYLDCDLSEEEIIVKLNPSIVVKGKEHESESGPLKGLVESYGGSLIFSSGEVQYSSLDLLNKEFTEFSFRKLLKPQAYIDRHSIKAESLLNIVNLFNGLNIIVIGDLIIDEYITCEPLGMSQEDPTIVVSPISTDRFIGGAAIVASHARSLGAKVSYFGLSGSDDCTIFANEKLHHYGIDTHIYEDDSRPTILKKRYRANGKTLLRVSHLRHHEISKDLSEQILEEIKPKLKFASMLVISDFNYGFLTKWLVDQLTIFCKEFNIPIVADSQSSSQVGDLMRFRDTLLLTPTEHEARLAIRDPSASLATLAESLKLQTNTKHLLIKLGSEGVMVCTSRIDVGNLLTDQLPALNTSPKDVSGAGDSMLIACSMSLICGASIWEASYIGSIAAAHQVGRLGNSPLVRKDIIQELHF